jgi:hypothetical protein
VGGVELGRSIAALGARLGSTARRSALGTRGDPGGTDPEWRVDVVVAAEGSVTTGLSVLSPSHPVKGRETTGFFTPLHHIASALIGPTAMMRSMEAGMAGDTFAI